MPSFKKSFIVEQLQGYYLKLKPERGFIHDPRIVGETLHSLNTCLGE